MSYLLDVSLSLKTGSYENLIIGIVVSASISIGLIMLIRVFIRNENKLVNMIEFYGKNSLIVLCVHPTLLLMFSYPFSSKVGELSTSVQVITAIVVLAVIVLAEIPFINLLTKYFPVLVGIEKDRK